MIDLYNGNKNAKYFVFLRMCVVWTRKGRIGKLNRQVFEDTLAAAAANIEKTASNSGHSKRLRSSLSAVTYSSTRPAFDFVFRVPADTLKKVNTKINSHNKHAIISKLFKKEEILLWGQQMRDLKLEKEYIDEMMRVPNSFKSWSLTVDEENQLIMYIRRGVPGDVADQKIRKFAESMASALTPGHVLGEYEDDYVHRIIYRLFDFFLFAEVKSRFTDIVVVGNGLKVGKVTTNKSHMKKADLGLKRVAEETALLIVEVKRINFPSKQEKDDDLEKLAGTMKESYEQISGVHPIFGVRIFGNEISFYENTVVLFLGTTTTSLLFWLYKAQLSSFLNL